MDQREIQSGGLVFENSRNPLSNIIHRIFEMALAMLPE